MTGDRMGRRDARQATLDGDVLCDGLGMLAGADGGRVTALTGVPAIPARAASPAAAGAAAEVAAERRLAVNRLAS